MKTAENGKAHAKLWFKELFVCNHCGNLIAFVKNSGVPVYSVKDGIVHVDVGSILHPMNEEHHIEWIIPANEIRESAQGTLSDR